MALQKVEKFQGLAKIAPETIEKYEAEQALRSAQHTLDCQLHDLKVEFLHRESKLRQSFLDRVAEIAGGAE